MGIDIVQLIGYIVSLFTAAGGWLLGRHTRHSNTITELLSTIDKLSRQISEYQDKIISLQNEIIEVRKENAELKSGQQIMTQKINEVQAENKELRQLLTSK